MCMCVCEVVRSCSSYAGRGSYTDASGAAALSRQPAVVTDELECYEALVEHAGGHCALLVFAA